MKYCFNGCLVKGLQASDQNLATHVKSGKSVITRCRSEDVTAQDAALMIKDRDRVVVDLCFVCRDWLPQIPDTNGLIKRCAHQLLSNEHQGADQIIMCVENAQAGSSRKAEQMNVISLAAASKALTWVE